MNKLPIFFTRIIAIFLISLSIQEVNSYVVWRGNCSKSHLISSYKAAPLECDTFVACNKTDHRLDIDLWTSLNSHEAYTNIAPGDCVGMVLPAGHCGKDIWWKDTGSNDWKGAQSNAPGCNPRYYITNDSGNYPSPGQGGIDISR